MKVDNINTINMVENHIRTLNVIDDAVLSVLKKIPRKIFVPEPYKQFSHVDMSIPIGKDQFMLMPSVEAKILQSLNIHKHEDILVVGSGTGYLSSCLSLLANKVHSIEIDEELVERSKVNIKQECIKNNLIIEKKDFTNDPMILSKYQIIVLTSSISNINILTDNMPHNSRAFLFYGSDDSPVKTGMIITKTIESGYTKEYIVETDVKKLIQSYD